MSTDWMPRLRGHVVLMKRLATEIPRALKRPSLTLEQAMRLHAVIQKGARDFDDVQRLMSGLEVEESYLTAAGRLARIWSHFADAAAERIKELQNDLNVKTEVDIEVTDEQREQSEKA